MRGWPSTRRARAALAAAALLLSSAALGDFTVTDIQARWRGATLELSGNLDLALTPKVEHALSKGIPLQVLIDVRLYRARRFLWDERLKSWHQRREIRYHALTDQYLVSAADADPDFDESFVTLSDALKYLGSISEQPIVLAHAPPPGRYHVAVRARLDIEALPAPLRPLAYVTFAWHLNSGWTTWKVGP